MGSDDEEREDYKNYMDAKNRDDPYRRDRDRRDNSDDRHSVGSDFDVDGNVKQDNHQKPAEQTDFFDLENDKKE